MKIVQGKDGNGYIEFSDTEKKMIQENGHIKMEAKSMKLFADHLFNISLKIVDLANVKEVPMCHEGDHIPTKE